MKSGFIQINADSYLYSYFTVTSSTVSDFSWQVSSFLSDYKNMTCESMVSLFWSDTTQIQTDVMILVVVRALPSYIL